MTKETQKTSGSVCQFGDVHSMSVSTDSNDWACRQIHFSGGLKNTHRAKVFVWLFISSLFTLLACVWILGVDTDELDSNVDDWEEETIEFFINEEVFPYGEL